MVIGSKGVSRRGFLKGAAALAAGAAALPAMNGLGLLAENGRVYAQNNAGYGPLLPTPDLRDGVERISLPEGFQYRSFNIAGEIMSDGNPVPLAHDGMASFIMPDGKIRLVCNHEDRNGPGLGSTAFDPATGYDPLGGGGTTTLVINPFTRELERNFISINGTIVNCAGGLTPWNSWITCEETNAGVPQGWSVQHGYCFDVPAALDSAVPAVPVPDMGRFSHEAVAVDPATGIVYETEDNGSTNSGFYRFIPNTPGVIAHGGKLQMLAIDGQPQYNTMTNQTVGVPLPVTWADIEDPNPPGTSSTAVSSQGRANGGAYFARLEGIWYGDGAFYFNATSGGNAGQGQVWEFRPEGDGGTLKLIFESPGVDVLSFPDNITVSPQGSLLLCEDPPGSNPNPFYLRGLTLNGELFDFAAQLTTRVDWAGATFAEAPASWNAAHIRGNNRPLGSRWDRLTLFVNIQGPTSGPNPPSPGNEGLTMAIWGPWNNGAL